MATQKLTALKSFKFGGKRLAVGDVFETSSVYARLYIALKKAEPAGKPKGWQPPKPPPAAPVAKEATTEPAPTSTAVPGMTKQVYKTRDTTPEK